MKNTRMSFWGIGPLFVILSVLIVAVSLFFSIRFELFLSTSLTIFTMVIIGVLIAIIGLCFWIPAGRSIDDFIRRGVLSQHGVYGIIRNPIYSGFLFVLTGICIASHRPLMLPVPAAIYFLLKILLRKEDKTLTEVFGEQYVGYKGRVNQILPNPSRMMSAWFYPVDSTRYNDKLFVIRDGDGNVFVYSDGTDYICIDGGYDASRLQKDQHRS